MDIFFSINNREKVIQLPIVPTSFKIPSPMKNETFTTINQGDIKLFGERGLKEFTIDSFFPAKDYPFAKDKTYKGWQYVEEFEAWRDRKLPIRIVATNTPINMAIVIDNFEYGLQDGSGDVYYSMSISEFKFIELATKPTTPLKDEAETEVAKKDPETSKKGDMKTSSIVDYLRSIGVDSSMDNRKKLAVKHEIKNYIGTSSQNRELLKKMRGT